MPGAEDQKTLQPGAEGNVANQTTSQNAGHDGAGQQGEDTSIYSDAKKAEEMIKALRAENAKHRTKNKDIESKYSAMEATLGRLKAAFGGEEDEVDPAQAAMQLQSHNEALQVELGIAQLALENGITKENGSYFKFLLAQRFEALGEGEEITDEDIQGIVSEVSKLSRGKSGNSTGLDSDSRPNADARSGMTVEAFAKLSVAEKSALYAKSPDQYSTLFKTALEKKLI